MAPFGGALDRRHGKYPDIPTHDWTRTENLAIDMGPLSDKFTRIDRQLESLKEKLARSEKVAADAIALLNEAKKSLDELADELHRRKDP